MSPSRVENKKIFETTNQTRWFKDHSKPPTNPPMKIAPSSIASLTASLDHLIESVNRGDTQHLNRRFFYVVYVYLIVCIYIYYNV